MPVNLTTGSTNALGAIDIASMDIETALMAVQTRRADLLESQLRGQLEAVQDRNMQIESINSILSAVRAIRPTGDADSTADTGDSNATIQVPATVTVGQGGSQAALAQLTKELNDLIAIKNGEAPPSGGGSTSGTTTLQVPSSVKIEDNSNPNTTDYVDGVNALVDLNAPLADESEFSDFVGGNNNLTSEFAAWVHNNQGVIEEMYGENFSIGFSSDSDQNDIGAALANNSDTRELFETFLRLSVQGNGTAGPPNTPIIVAASGTGGGTGGGTTGGGSIPDDIDQQIADKQAEILALQKDPGVTSTTTTSMSLNAALSAYGFTPTGKLTQAQFDQLIPTITSRIDSLNSSQQLDMLRLQNLTNKRNEAFDVMTNFIKKLQDNRSSIVGNLR